MNNNYKIAKELADRIQHVLDKYPYEGTSYTMNKADCEMVVTSLRARPALPAPVAPEGWVLVPIEPTRAMIQAIMQNIGSAYVTENIKQAHREDCIDAYSALLAAAPKRKPVMTEITEKMVEAAAKAMWEVSAHHHNWTWEDCSPFFDHKPWLARARAALLAAIKVDTPPPLDNVENGAVGAQSLHDRALEFVRGAFKDFGLSDDRLREYASIFEELMQGAIDNATPPILARAEHAEAELAKLHQFTKRLSDALIKVRPLGGSELFVRYSHDNDRLHYADPDYCGRLVEELHASSFDANERAVIAERERDALDKSHASLARQLADKQREIEVIRAATLETAAQLCEDYKRDASYDDSAVGFSEHQNNQWNIAQAIRALAPLRNR